MLNIWIYK